MIEFTPNDPIMFLFGVISGLVLIAIGLTYNNIGNDVQKEFIELQKTWSERDMTQPDYYKKDGLSPLDAFEQGLISREEYIGFLKGNVIKYTIRAGKKDNACKDIDKAIDYLNWLKKELGK